MGAWAPEIVVDKILYGSCLEEWGEELRVRETVKENRKISFKCQLTSYTLP